MYKSYTEVNGREFPMMIGKSVRWGVMDTCELTVRDKSSREVGLQNRR